ncbi:cytidylyltransferase domain-containing protein [Chromobacterium violaceum]|uniref:acylneuraminate cytidylyltransferase family protein n=1 Tax=Chromobacterium violaceum TaxID=536 RepID=UPI0005D2D926|nr:acylneuraminate cytidylyltransferase family protein [Chromobacterium violaceum]
MQKVLAIIPARGGSKRLPRKNVRLLGGVPLIERTISAALQCDVISAVLVSTDDSEIADVSRAAGAMVPWLRPADLATDVSGSADVTIHALDWYEREHGEVDAVILLQPTSPFRKIETIYATVTDFLSRNLKSLVSVSPTSTHPAWCFSEENGHITPLQGWDKLHKRSQDLDPVYALNGLIYICTPAFLRESRSFISQDSKIFLIEDLIESHDIDTPLDWIVAESYLDQLKHFSDWDRHE